MFDQQNNTKKGSIFAGEEFSFQLKQNTFEDQDDQLKISVLLLYEGQYIEIPSNFWLFYQESTMRLVGNPSEEHYRKKVTLKYIATDGYYTVEDYIIINPDKLTAYYLLRSVASILSPILVLIGFILKFRVQIHRKIFHNKYHFGEENVAVNQEFKKFIPLLFSRFLQAKEIFNKIKLNSIMKTILLQQEELQQREINKQQWWQGNKVQLEGSLGLLDCDTEIINFDIYFQELQQIYKKKFKVLKLTNQPIDFKSQFFQLVFKILICQKILVKNKKLSKTFKQLRKMCIKLKNHMKNQWYKEIVDISYKSYLNQGEEDQHQIPFPDLKIDQIKLQQWIGDQNYDNLHIEIFKFSLLGVSLGLAPNNLGTPYEGESLKQRPEEIQTIFVLKKVQHQQNFVKNFIRRICNDEYYPIQMTKNRQMPEWLDFDIENNQIHIFGSPPIINHKDYLIRIQDSRGFLIRQFQLKVMDQKNDLLNDSENNLISPNRQIVGYNNRVAAMRSSNINQIMKKSGFQKDSQQKSFNDNINEVTDFHPYLLSSKHMNQKYELCDYQSPSEKESRKMFSKDSILLSPTFKQMDESIPKEYMVESQATLMNKTKEQPIFLEHMLFMGTKTYPDESEYSSYLTKNGGMSNAYTDLMQTNYFFQCSNQAFGGALDRFSKFFSESLFDPSCVDREINAVNSEHEKNLQQDMWRQFQLLRHSGKEGNAFTKFGTGSLQTLKKDSIRDDLLTFYNNYYSANFMKLVVTSDQTIEQLQESVVNKFSQVPNYNYTRTVYNEMPFNKDNMGQFWKIAPVKDQDSIEFSWMIQNQLPLYKSSPAKYLSHVLGHEGKNSLFSKLKSEGYAMELSTHPWDLMNLFTLFQMEIKLTKLGLENYEKVINIVFAYLKMMREKGPQKYVFDEIQIIEKLKFDNLDKKKGMDYVLTLGKNMQLYDLEDIIRVRFLMEEYNEQQIKDTLDQISTENLRIYLTSKSIESECNLTEPVYGTKYSFSPFNNSYLETFQNPEKITDIDYPPPNDFIPKNMDLVTQDYSQLPKYPKNVLSTPQTNIYFKQDNTFKTPKAVVFCSIYTCDKGIVKLPRSDLLADIWVSVFNETIKEMQYQAEMAYVDSQFCSKKNKLEFIARGFNDSLDKYVEQFFQALSAFNPVNHIEIFQTKLEDIKQKYKNFFLGNPYQQAFTYQNALLKTGHHDTLINIQLLNNIKFEDLVDFHNGWLENINFEWLIEGNLLEQQAKEMAQKAEQILFQNKQFSILHDDLQIDMRSIQLSSEIEFFWERVLQPNESNSAVIHYYQTQGSQENKLLLDFILNIIKDPFFQDLRTKQSLGYIVFSMTNDNRGVFGFEFLVQSDVKGPQALGERINQFLIDFKKTIEELPDSEFETYRNSIIDNIKEKDQNVVSEGMRYWGEIEKHRFEFDRQQALLEKIPSISKQRVVEYFNEIFFERKKKLEIHLISEKHREENIQLKEKRLKENPSHRFVPSIDWLKKQVPLYPDFEAKL